MPSKTLFGYFSRVSAVLLEYPRWRKLPKLMAHHVFSDENRVENFPVVNKKCVPDEIGNNRRATRPRFDRFFAPACGDFVDLLEQMLVDEGSFLEAASHKLQ